MKFIRFFNRWIRWRWTGRRPPLRGAVRGHQSGAAAVEIQSGSAGQSGRQFRRFFRLGRRLRGGGRSWTGHDVRHVPWTTRVAFRFVHFPYANLFKCGINFHWKIRFGEVEGERRSVDSFAARAVRRNFAIRRSGQRPDEAPPPQLVLNQNGHQSIHQPHEETQHCQRGWARRSLQKSRQMARSVSGEGQGSGRLTSAAKRPEERNLGLAPVPSSDHHHSAARIVGQQRQRQRKAIRTRYVHLLPDANHRSGAPISRRKVGHVICERNCFQKRQMRLTVFSEARNSTQMIVNYLSWIL